jgi:hypothetical protein
LSLTILVGVDFVLAYRNPSRILRTLGVAFGATLALLDAIR